MSALTPGSIGGTFSGFQVARRAGDGLGHETDLSSWKTVARGTLAVTSVGPFDSDGGRLHTVNLNKNILLKAGQTYGIRLVMPGSVKHIFAEKLTNSRLRLTYKNPDLELKFGSVRPGYLNVKSTGYKSAAWNSQLTYSVVPLPAAGWLFISALGGLLTMRAGKQRQICPV